MPAGFDGWLAVYAAVVVLAAYVIRGIAGFGSGLIAVPLLSAVVPVATAVPVVVSLDYLGSAGQSARHARHVVWREQLVLVPFMLVGVTLGLFILHSLPTTILSRALGLFVIAYAVYQLLPLSPMRGSRLSAVSCGLMGGLMGTLFGTGGPFYAMYFNLRGLDKSAFRATFATNFMIDGGVRLLGYAVSGLLGWQTLSWVILALPLMVIGLFVGGRIHLDLPERVFIRLVCGILLASGTALILS
jgi:uncharacterized membrane protein YfcA